MTATSKHSPKNLIVGISSRLSLDDFSRLCELAQAQHMSVARFIRALVLKEIAR